METRAWQGLTFNYPPHIPTMLSQEEMVYLYWLGKSVWDGKGIIIEIGPWLGGSTACLAAGMKGSPHDAQKRLKVFDNFIWREFMAERAPLPIQPGNSFEPFFRENISGFREIVEVHARALPDEAISHDREAQKKRFHETGKVPIFENLYRDPVAVLFIDGAKSWKGMLHLLKTLNKNLVPSKSYLVCQDYKYWGTYWVPVMMTRLEKYVEPVHNVLSATTVTFRVTTAIPDRLFEHYEEDARQLDTDKTLAAIDKAASMLALEGDTLGAANVLLGKVSFLSHQGKVDLAAAAFKQCQCSWKAFQPRWQLERVRQYLSSEKSIDIPRPLSHKIVDMLQKGSRKIKGIIKKCF